MTCVINFSFQEVVAHPRSVTTIVWTWWLSRWQPYSLQLSFISMFEEIDAKEFLPLFAVFSFSILLDSIAWHPGLPVRYHGCAHHVTNPLHPVLFFCRNKSFSLPTIMKRNSPRNSNYSNNAFKNFIDTNSNNNRAFRRKISLAVPRWRPWAWTFDRLRTIWKKYAIICDTWRRKWKTMTDRRRTDRIGSKSHWFSIEHFSSPIALGLLYLWSWCFPKPSISPRPIGHCPT